MEGRSSTNRFCMVDKYTCYRRKPGQRGTGILANNQIFQRMSGTPFCLTNERLVLQDWFCVVVILRRTFMPLVEDCSIQRLEH